MRIPDPIANTTTEAYLAYKAGVLSEGDLKPKLYDPYIHLDAWLAYWAGLTTTYPVKNVGKNLFNKDSYSGGDYFIDTSFSMINTSSQGGYGSCYIPICSDGRSYTVSKVASSRFIVGTTVLKPAVNVPVGDIVMDYSATEITVTPSAGANYLVVYFYRRASDTKTLQEIADSIQIEEGSTATAYEPYTGEPEMLTDEEALIAYLSGVTNTYPEEFRDPADVRVAAYLKYLVSARWGRPEYPVTNEELYLSMMDAPYIPAGEPSSDIEIDDTAEAPFKDVKMYGNTTQQTYSGKNLLKMPIVSGSSNGITWTVQDDGSIILNGTSTAGVSIRANNVTIPAVEGETYTLSATGMGEAYNFGYKKSSSGDNIFVVTSASPTTTAVVTSTMLSQANRLDMYIQSGKTFNNQRVTLQLEKGSLASSFEPYVGGVPAPNPDYPQAVNTVTGRQVVKVEGKNLFNNFVAPISDSLTPAGVSWSLEGDGTMHTSGTNSVIYRFIRYEITLPAGSYWFGGCPSGGSVDGYSMIVQTDFNDPNTVVFDTGSGNTFTLTQQTTIQVFPIRIGSQTVNMDGKVFKPIIVAGSTATTYEPYQGQSYEVNLGKNLFDKDTVLGGKLLFENGAVGGDDPDYCTSDFIPVVPGKTYYKTWSTSVRFKYFGADKEPLNTTTYQDIPNAARPQSFVVPSGAYYLRLTLGTNNRSTLQIEVGSTPTSYAPYFTPIELCKIGDYQDSIYENEGKWYLHKEVGKALFNDYVDTARRGTTNTSGKYRFHLTVPGVLPAATIGTTVPSYCSHIVPGTVGQTYTTQQRIAIDVGTNNYVFMFTTDTEAMSEDEFKAWLTGKNMSFYYPLATPTDTEITNTALIDQLNALKGGGSYTGTTYIKVSAIDPNLPGLLKVEAYKYD